MNNYTFSLPTKIVFGEGTTDSLAELLQKDGISKVLLLTGGQSVYKSGLYDKVCANLKAHGIHYESVQGVQPNPRLSKAVEAVERAKSFSAEAIVPVGGGSVFDCAKGVAVGFYADKPLWSYYEKKQLATKALPIYGILTLSGTSSEVNFTSVLTNDETHIKCSLASEPMTPKVSIVDPTLQYTVPLTQVMACGVDALSHIFEAYMMGFDTAEVVIEQCEAYARSIIRCLKKMPKEEKNYDTRSELVFSSIYAHSGIAALGRACRGDFSSHRIGHTLSGLFDITHGVTLSIIMPAWMRYLYNQGEQLDILARMGREVFGLSKSDGDDAIRGIEAFEDFLKSIGMPLKMGEVGIKEDDIPRMVELTLPILPFGAVEPMTKQSIEAIYRIAL